MNKRFGDGGLISLTCPKPRPGFQTSLNVRGTLLSSHWIACLIKTRKQITFAHVHEYQEERVVILLTGLTPQHLCVCPKSGSGFYFVQSGGKKLFFVFADIGGFVDHHCKLCPRGRLKCFWGNKMICIVLYCVLF